jgi:hypothetical protein
MTLPQSLARRLSKNVTFMVADSAVNNLVSFAIVFTIARVYNDPGIVGQVNLLIAITAVGVLLGDLGNGQASTLLISRHLAGVGGSRPGEGAGAGLLHAAVGGALLGAAAFFLPDVVETLTRHAGLVGRAEAVGQIRDQVRLIAVWVLACTLMQQTAGIFNGLQRMELTLLQDTVVQVPRLVICVALALTAQAWQTMIWAWTFGYVAAAGAALAVLAWLLNRPPQTNHQFLKELNSCCHLNPCQC